MKAKISKHKAIVKKSEKKVMKKVVTKSKTSVKIIKKAAAKPTVKVITKKPKILESVKDIKQLNDDINYIENTVDDLEKEYEEKPVESPEIKIEPTIVEEKIVLQEASKEIIDDSIPIELKTIPVKIEKEEKKTVHEAPEKTDDSDNKNKVEALLFACGKYIEEQNIAELCNIDRRKVRKVLEELRSDYDQKNGSLMIFQEDHSWKINVREKYLSIVRKIVSDTELNRSTMETLAVIAWKSPVYQSEIVKIRGNKCYDHIEDLETLGFVLKDKKGRSYILRTTDKFYNYFDIDQGNLKGVLETVKVPEKTQQTLVQVEPETENLGIADAINVKKKSESEEEKLAHTEFLSKIENRIMEVAEKNNLLEQEFPLQKSIEIAQNSEAVNPADNSEDKIDNAPAASRQDASNPPQNVIEVKEPKHKSLTKKQLEKKFKEELLRVRDKLEKK